MSLNIPTWADCVAKDLKPEVLFWVGCAGSFDERAKKITKAFVTLLNKAEVSFAVLGTEESCTGDPAKRAGNEFLFQMQALSNIETLNGYGVQKIVTTCPHCFNTLKNEYPALGGQYEVMHHTQFLKSLLAEGKLKIEGGIYRGKRITFHDPCYLGRANGEFEAPRALLSAIEAEISEMKSCKQKGLCCGAGGAQLFKEPEKGHKDINIARTEEVLDSKATIVAAACPFCNTMFSDGMKHKQKEEEIQVMDLAEMIANATDIKW